MTHGFTTRGFLILPRVLLCVTPADPAAQPPVVEAPRESGFRKFWRRSARGLPVGHTLAARHEKRRVEVEGLSCRNPDEVLTES